MNSRSAVPVPVALAIVGVGLCVSPIRGQTWELDIRRVTIDHDAPPTLSASFEQIPRGFGISARHLWESGAFLELEFSRGSDRRIGAICGGFIFDPVTQCVAESVGYSGGLVALSMGWQFRLDLGSAWWLGIRPRAGIGAVWVSEVGRDTGREHFEAPSTLVAGIGAEVARTLPWYGLFVSASVGADHLRPMRLGQCLDCHQVLDSPLPQMRVGIGVGWRMP